MASLMFSSVRVVLPVRAAFAFLKPLETISNM